MSQTTYSDPFTSISDFFGDAPLFTTPSDVESTNLDHHYGLSPFPNLIGPTTGYQHSLVQSVEPPPAIDGPSHGLRVRSDEHSQGLNLTGPYSAMDNHNNPPVMPYTGNVEVDDLPHPTPAFAEHHGDQTHDSRHYIPIAPGPPRLEYYAPMAFELTDDDDASHGSVPVLGNVAGPTRRHPIPMSSRMSDNEGLKRMISQYLNNPGSHVNDLHVSPGRFGGRKISIILEIDD